MQSANTASSLMLKETLQAPKVVENQIKQNIHALSELVARFAGKPPSLLVTCARGSSDHASVYGKYIAQILLGIPTLSFAPSVGSVYGKHLALSNALFICVSQSGKSPDLILNAEIAKKSGAYVVAFVNDVSSPLAALADLVIPLHAGAELSVAATKSFIATLTAFAQLIAIWTNDKQLQYGLDALPDQLAQSAELNWGKAVDFLKPQKNMLVLARGVGYGVALESALKFKETCILHAEAFSIAEVMHGPMALIEQNFPIIAYVQDDATKVGSLDIIDQLRQKGARILLAQAERPTGEFAADHLPIITAIHPTLQPIGMIQSFYRMNNDLAFERGYNPDTPIHLNKITQTR